MTRPLSKTSKSIKLLINLAILGGLFITDTSARRCPTAGILAGYSGVVSSPHFPEDYPHRVNCEWIIMVPKGYHVQLVFTTFDIEYCVFCKCDYVEIRDGRNSSSPLLGKYCENGKLSPIYSTGRHLWIKFYSDVGARFQGFRAVYKAKKTGQTYGKIINVRGERGLISNPKTIAACGADRRCAWLVRVKKASQIKLRFDRISLSECSTPCGCDYIEVRDGSNSSGRLIAKFCDSIAKPENICSSTNLLWIQFKYGLDLADHGFRATFERSQCKARKSPEPTIQVMTGTLDTVVGLLCASFVFMAFMTLCMVCIASRKISFNRKTRNSNTTNNQVTREQEEMCDINLLEKAPNICPHHTHAYWHYSKSSETDYSEETEKHGCESENEIPVHFCRNCKKGPHNRPIAVL
ncbi:tolloid-like protein 1 isoform X2 [Actinia tenebrosa]|uniref:Tolloid-like protein 1 isoform X2 n=1 Tax=Actinia tenebrosa TaxID=6105 RepID=A0A6P8H3Q5_ACTTE|nr:tolloid-like protein 1 isoform X2 [Actinia tenebrosa]